MTVLTPAAIMRQHLLQQSTPLKQSESSKARATSEPSIFDRLARQPLPDTEINDLLNLHDTLSIDDVIQRLDSIVQRMTGWLATAQMAVFTLEMEAKNDPGNSHAPTDAGSLLELSFGRMEPFVSILNEVSDIVIDKLDYHENDGQFQQKKLATRMSISKIQSEWSGLQRCLASVLDQLDSAQAEKELTALMERVLQQIDDLLMTVFQIQEKRHTCSDAVTITTTTTEDSSTENDQVLVDIDNRIEPLFYDVQCIYAAMTSNCPPADASGVLGRVHHKIQHRWETLRIEVDFLKQELKEERWLNVFRQVADQVDVMVDGLNKTVSQCHEVIQQVRAGRLPPPDKFQGVEKSFEAKHKYYTPSIDKMLGMLRDGIVAKMAGDNATTQRFDGMTQRWASLKTTMEHLISRDLPETGRLVLAPDAHLTADMRSARITRQMRLGSVDAVFDQQHPLRRSMSPSSREALAHRRPSSALGRERTARLRPSASESSLLNPSARRNAPIRRTTTLRNNGIPPSGSLSGDHPPPPQPPRRADPSWLLEPPKNMPGRRTQSVDHGVPPNRPRTPMSRSKTPSTSDLRKSRTPRSKSSLGQRYPDNDNDDDDMPPPRRSMTPSLIPRPKTPTSRQPPSFIPRPCSSMTFRSPSSSTDQSVASSVLSSPPSSAAVPERSVSTRLRKKHSMPSLRSSRATHVPRTTTAARHQNHTTTDLLSQQQKDNTYHADPRDALDVEVARIVNACPIRIKCQRGPSAGRYFFGNDLNLGGRKQYTCKLMSYTDRDNRRRPAAAKENKVLVRVGGGWQDLEMFLLDHSNLMATTHDVVARPYSSMAYR